MTITSNTQKTVIFQDSVYGWFDAEDPYHWFPTRSEARQARHDRLGLPTRIKRGVSGSRIATPSVPARNNDGFSSLQRKLFNRLTGLQGVDADTARTVVLGNGHNKAASYGHMRAAGASHAEAQTVIDLNDPHVSLAYGRRREAGYGHTDALAGALRQTQTFSVTVTGV